MMSLYDSDKKRLSRTILVDKLFTTGVRIQTLEFTSLMLLFRTSQLEGGTKIRKTKQGRFFLIPAAVSYTLSRARRVILTEPASLSRYAVKV